MITYVGLKASSTTSQVLSKRYSRLGIRDLNKDLHVTLMYAPDQDKAALIKTNPERIYKCRVIGVETLGEGKWKAVVLKLHCPRLMRRHAAMSKVYGLVHSYPDFNLHVSLKYQPNEIDEDIVTSDIDIIGRVLEFSGEYVESFSS